MSRGTSVWLRGLWRAFIGGLSTAVITSAWDPHKDADWSRFIIIAGWSGIVSLFNYLSQSPLPPDNENQ